MRALDHKFQIEVMDANTIKSLLSSDSGSNIKPFHTSGLDPKNILYIYLDPDVEERMSCCWVSLSPCTWFEWKLAIAYFTTCRKSK